MENDGEVVCPQCRANLNRNDKLCWRCGRADLPPVILAQEVTSFTFVDDPELDKLIASLRESQKKDPGF